MGLLHSVGKQKLHGLSQQLGPRVAEELFCLAIDPGQAPLDIDDQDCIRRLLGHCLHDGFGEVTGRNRRLLRRGTLLVAALIGSGTHPTLCLRGLGALLP